MTVSLSRKRKTQPGAPPGTLSHDGIVYQHQTTFELRQYDSQTQHSVDIPVGDRVKKYWEKGKVSWLNVIGVSDAVSIGNIGKDLALHPLVQEDIMHTDQRPKVEIFGNQMCVMVRMIRIDDSLQIVSEQVSCILGDGYLITFQERAGDVFDPVRQRIELKLGQVRDKGADYLMYALLDIIVDHYFVVLERISDLIEQLEDRVLEDSSPAVSREIHERKKELIFIRKAVWPLREVLNTLLRDEVESVQPETLPYLRDLYDHVIQVMDQIETCRDVLSGVSDSYMSGVSNKMNSIMKVLTLISTLFIPLTFLAGIYGMNFTHMPELQWRFGYPVLLGVMVLIAIGMFIFFRKKKWL